MITAADSAALDEAVRLLRAGQLVAMPTETVYGLAGDARSEAALLAIFSTKERPLFDPLIVHVPAPTAGQDAVERLSSAGLVGGAALSVSARDVVARLTARFWPGPLTLVLPRGPALPDLVSSGLPTVAVRAPRHPVAEALLQRAGMPLAAPSANRFGRISPTRAADVEAELGERVPLILDGGPCAIGVESTVVAVGLDGRLTLLRPGGAGVAELAEVAPFTTTPMKTATQSEQAQPSPGLLASHYAPRKPLHLLSRGVADLPADARKVGLLLFSHAHLDQASALLADGRVTELRTLSPTGDVAEAARRLFAELRALDAGPAEVLWAESCPEVGLGLAIVDRLRRAAAPR